MNQESNVVNIQKRHNIKRMTLAYKEKRYKDLINIERSLTGRIDVYGYANTFIKESIQMIVNAIELFEQGYFDAAFYSLRTSSDIALSLVYLADISEESQSQELNDWRKQEWFPGRSCMIKHLKERGQVFTEMIEKLEHFFKDAKFVNDKLNQRVHKQGYHNFYRVRSDPLFQHKYEDSLEIDFDYLMEKVIGIVAVMRLMIDPFPVLLMEEDILFRNFLSLTEPYSDDFVESYIGERVIQDYKSTRLYQDTRSWLMTLEPLQISVFNVKKNCFIDSRKIDEIKSQFDLLSKEERISVLMVSACEKVVKVYCNKSFDMFFTEKETQRKEMSWNSLDFQAFAEAESKTNQEFGEANISVFVWGNEFYFAEHNEKLSQEEVDRLDLIVKEGLSTS